MTGPPGGDKPGPHGQLYTQHAAELRAQVDAALVRLPSGATLQRTPVPSLLTQSGEGMGTTTGKDDHWWIVSGKVGDAMGFVKQHPPTGMTSAGSSGTEDGTGESTLDFDFGPAAHQPATLLGVSFAQDGDHVAIRVQVQVAYVPTRTAVETIPASVTSGTAVYQPPNQLLPDKVTPAPRRAATLSAADVRIIADALNGLDAQATGIVHSCPAPNGEAAWFTFAYGGHTVVFHVEPNGCGGVLVAADGVAQPELGLDEAVYNGIEKSLHVTKAENPELTAAS